MSNELKLPLPLKVRGVEIIGAEGTEDAWVICRATWGCISPAPLFDSFSREHGPMFDKTRFILESIVTAVNSHATLQAEAERLRETLGDIEELSNSYPGFTAFTTIAAWAHEALVRTPASTPKLRGRNPTQRRKNNDIANRENGSDNQLVG